LTAAAEAIADGDYQHHVSLSHRDELGKLAGVFNRMSRQLRTREAELRESRERLAAVLGGMSEGVIAVDDDERIVFANATAGKMLGFSADQVEGRSFLESVRNHKLYRAIEEARANNASRQLEIKIGIREPRVLNVSLTLLGGDTAPRVILSLHDVTNLRRLETLRRDFVANVSHELKTPLSSIKAYAETLSAGALHDHANNLRFVQQIEEQAERLNDLIMDLMSLAQIESGQKTYNIAPLSVAETVHSCLADYRLTAQAKGVRLVANASSEDIVVAADESALFQILDNLVDNAVKYTPTGGTVTVRWRALEAQREGEIEVEDNGIGIAEEHVARLYERFFRVDKARSRELGGTGLGLAIVKHLVQALGGSVHVESRLAQGTRFTIRLPLV
jgi:two-component system phosphate regulon sensor histidine kinase PhoR